MNEKNTGKKAILVVSFGTSYKETREKNIDVIEKEIAKEWPDWEVRRAFTSGMILNVLKKRDGIHINNVIEAIEELIEEGFTKLVVQPTHILNGDEYEKMINHIEPFKDKFAMLKIGAPLLSSSDDYEIVCLAINYSFGTFMSDEALVLMGHGTGHYADSAYAALDYRFKALGYPHVFVGTVEGYPSLEDIMPAIERYAPKKVTLLPLMIVAGDHATNDMAGDDEDSWKSKFINKGFEVECFLRGLGEIPVISKIYISHIKKAMKEEDA